MYLIHSPPGIWKHGYSLKESTVDCVKVDSPPNLSVKIGVKQGGFWSSMTIDNTWFPDVDACSSKATLSALHPLSSQKAACPQIFWQLNHF